MRNAVVTGGTKGIGLGIVRYLLKKGYRVITNYCNDTEQAENIIKEFREYKRSLSVMKADQNNREEVKEFVKYIRTKFDGIDCIICNAGATVRKSSFELSDDDWQSIFNISLNSHFFIIRDLHDIIRDNARIIFIGSMMGIYPHATSLPYGVSKAAVHALSRNLVKDFTGTGITINTIAPGFVETEWQRNKPQKIKESINNKTAIGRFAYTSEIVSAVDFIINNPFVNGSVIEVSGGYCYR